jgi:uncharacterized membrane protein YgcG
MQQQLLLNQQQAQLAASLAVSGGAAASATPVSSAPHRKMTLSTVALFRTCGLCNEVCWGVALQAYTCGDCHTAFHRRCQQAAALQTACTPLEKNRGSKIKAAKQFDLYDVPKKRKRLDKCLQEIAAESHVSVERMLEFMTWVASAYDQFNGEALFAVLHAKPVSAGVMPAVVESLASRDIFTRLVVIQVLQQLLYLESNKVALIAKGGISLLLQSLRDLQMYFLNSVSLTTANASGGGGGGLSNSNAGNNNNSASASSSSSGGSASASGGGSGSGATGSGGGGGGGAPMPGAPGSPQYNAYARAALSPRSRRLTTPPRELNLAMVNQAGNVRDDSTVISPFYEQYIQHTLAVLVFLANEESRAAFEREDALDTLLQLCRFTTNNQVLRYCLGALLIQFTDDEDAWRRIVSDPQQEAVRIVLAAAESGVATLHREIRPSEVTLERSLFQSPLCEVVAGALEVRAPSPSRCLTPTRSRGRGTRSSPRWRCWRSRSTATSCGLYGAHSRPHVAAAVHRDGARRRAPSATWSTRLRSAAAAAC